MGKQKITCTCTNRRYVTLFVRTNDTALSYKLLDSNHKVRVNGSLNHLPSPQDAPPSLSGSSSYLYNHTQIISIIRNRCHYSLWHSPHSTVSKQQHATQNKALLCYRQAFLFVVFLASSSVKIGCIWPAHCLSSVRLCMRVGLETVYKT